MDDIAEEQIITRLKQGDEQAFKTIYDRYYTLLCNYATNILKDDSKSEEIVDDAIFYLWEHRSTINLYAVRSYLLKSIRNRCLNELNALEHRMEQNVSIYISDENIEFLNILFSDHSNTLNELVAKDLEKDVNESIEHLPDECRRVFIKSRFEHKSYDEIANELGISKNTVKYHIKNALATLHENLKEYLRLIIVILLIQS